MPIASVISLVTALLLNIVKKRILSTKKERLKNRSKKLPELGSNQQPLG